MAGIGDRDGVGDRRVEPATTEVWLAVLVTEKAESLVTVVEVGGVVWQPPRVVQPGPAQTAELAIGPVAFPFTVTWNVSM